MSEVRKKAGEFIKSKEGEAVLKKALAGFHLATSKELKLSISEKELASKFNEELSQVLSGSVYSFTHFLRTWSLQEARPSAPDHLKRCWTCNLILNDFLKLFKLQPLPLLRPEIKKVGLSEKKIVSILKKADHSLFHGLSAETCDLDGDGFLETTRYSDGKQIRFTTYLVDLNYDAVPDLTFQLENNRWISVPAGPR